MLVTQDKTVQVEMSTSYETFQKWLTDDERSRGLDPGNMKLAFNSVSIKIKYPV